MPKALVIVESPAKAKTIGQFLGDKFDVRASYGHIRDLPNSASEIPPELKKEKWARLGVDVEKDFNPLYIVPPDKEKHVRELKKSLKGADELLLATDEDREGESISWHLLEVLKPKMPVKRLVFHEITREAIERSLQGARQVDANLVRAQETRRIVDRLFGYLVSPLLWKKMLPRLSAGRVQSVATRLLVERERERMRFKSAEYWDLKAAFRNMAGAQFEADLLEVDGRRAASGKDFDPATGALDTKSNSVHLTADSALRLKDELEAAAASVVSVEKKPFTSRPPAPFTTSTLQQEASRKLGFGARHTMSVAQRLYENGVITYMRTDSTSLSEEALRGARALIGREFGREYLPAEPRLYKTKVRNAQEAHEAIRPAGAEFMPIPVVRARFGDEAGRLYELIWKRTIASQMEDSKETRVAVDISCGRALFRATGKSILFPGFLRAYVEGSDDPEAELADREKILPDLSPQEELRMGGLEALKHLTQPPPRYTEGSLIKELEKRGIGRPSTWATIVEVVLSRTYAFKKNGALVPTFLAMALTLLMERYFSNFMDYEFTAHLEDDLDSISRGEALNLDYLKTFYFGNGHAGLAQLVKDGEEQIDPREVCGLPIGPGSEGRHIEVRIGRFGPFLTDGENRASLPDNLAPDELTLERAEQVLQDAAKGPDKLGVDPVQGQPVYLKKGRFGPYVQLGEQEEGGEKPKMASLLPGMTPESVTLDLALALLSLPRSLGMNPENGEEVVVYSGRYGPYIKTKSETRSIPLDQMSPLNMTLAQAIELLKQPKTRGRGATPKQLRELGNHPVSGSPLVIKSGRYGPYVTDGKLNASLPRSVTPEALTISEAVELLQKRAEAEASGTTRKRTKKSTVSKKKKA